MADVPSVDRSARLIEQFAEAVEISRNGEALLAEMEDDDSERGPAGLLPEREEAAMLIRVNPPRDAGKGDGDAQD